MSLQELNEHFELRDRLAKAKDILASLHDAIYPKSPAMTGMPHGSGVSDRVGNLAAEIADMSASIKALETEIEQSETKILEFISGIDDDQTRLIFRLRFIRGLTWKEVASIIGGHNTEVGVKTACYRYLETCIA